MLNRNLIFTLILIAGLILQVTLFSFFTPWDIKPDLLLVIIVVISILEGPRTGLLVGFLGGLLQDVFLGEFISVNTIIKAPLGFVSGLLEGHFYKGNFLLPPLVAFSASIIYHFLTIFLTEHLMFNINYWTAFTKKIFPTSIYNAVLSLLIYYLVYKTFYHGERYYEK